MDRKEFLKTAVTIAAAPALMPWTHSAMGYVGTSSNQDQTWKPKGGFTIAQLNAIVEEYYGDPDDVSDIGRARKMQALMMEVAIRAKIRNQSFQLIPQDTLQYAHIDGNPENEYDWNILNLLDGWGIENFSATTVTRLANLTKVGIKGTANTNGSTVEIVTENQRIAAENNILWHPRLSGEVYRSPGKGNPSYFPYYYNSHNHYDIVHHPIPAGVGHTINNNDVNCMMDAKNHLHVTNNSRYAGWPTWDINPGSRLDISSGSARLVPFLGGRYQPIGTAADQAIADHGNEWDWFWKAKSYTQDEGRKAYIDDLAASEWDVFYVDAHYNDMNSLTKEEVEKLKWKPQGGRRQVIAYLSIGTTELYRWYVDPVMVNTNPRSFRQGKVENDVFIPARTLYGDNSIPNWMLWPAYSGQYASEATPIWWHPEWRDIIVRGGSPYKNPGYNHSLFPDGRSSIDKIVDMGFDGVYMDNVSRATSGSANWTALQAYNKVNPGWYLIP